MKRLTPGFFILWIFSLAASAQEPALSYEDTLRAYEGLFKDDFPLELTIRYDIKHFQRTRRREKYQPAELTNQVNDSFRVTHPVRVKARGMYRRDHCSVPPFWLNIRYSGILVPELEGIRRLKMVTRCRGSRAYEHYILREYLVYRIYNLISPYSFRVRLVRLRQVDTGRKNRESVDWAFLIEHHDMLANRLGGKEVKIDELSMRTVNREIMDLLAMFQYMIGNGDYSVTGRQNLKILALETGPHGFLPVPYDFDYTGLVNTHYAVPGESLGISSVRERYFLGPCRNKASHLWAVERLRSVREEIIRLIREFDYLPSEEREDMIAYIEGFYKEAEGERFVEIHIASTCR